MSMRLSEEARLAMAASVQEIRNVSHGQIVDADTLAVVVERIEPGESWTANVSGNFRVKTVFEDGSWVMSESFEDFARGAL